MTDKELSKLNRRELLEILLEISKENDELRQEIHELKEELHNKNTIIENTNSLSDVISKLHDVIDNAKVVVNIDHLDELTNNTDVSTTIPISDSSYFLDEEPEEEIIEEIQELIEEINDDSTVESIIVEEKIKNKDELYWDELVNRLELFVSEHQDLKDVVNLELFKSGDKQ